MPFEEFLDVCEARLKETKANLGGWCHIELTNRIVKDISNQPDQYTQLAKLREWDDVLYGIFSISNEAFFEKPKKAYPNHERLNNIAHEAHKLVMLIFDTNYELDRIYRGGASGADIQKWKETEKRMFEDLFGDITADKLKELQDNEDWYGLMVMCSEAISRGRKYAGIYVYRAHAYVELCKRLLDSGDKDGARADIRRAISDFETSLSISPSDDWVREQIVELRKFESLIK